MKNLKTLRKQKNIKQEEVAKAILIPRSTYQSYEYGAAEPNIETLTKLADYFHTTIDHIVGHEVPYLINKSEFSSEQLLAINEIKTMDKNKIEKLLAYIDGLKDRN